MITIFLGAPGSGKGTISSELKERGFKHISTGEIFRATIGSGSELGLRVKGIIEAGHLVDDATTAEVLIDGLSKLDLVNDKIIIDGYPRNIEQAKFLEDFLTKNDLELTNPIYFEVPNDVILARLTGRWMCKECGKSYHSIFMPPKQEGVCDDDGSALYQREDDKIENVQVRLDAYNDVTSPLIEYYKEKGILVTIDGNRDVEEIVEDTLKYF